MKSGNQFANPRKILDAVWLVISPRCNVELIQLKIINPEQTKSNWLYLSLKNWNLLIFREILIDTKKNIRLIGKADGKKKTPVKKDCSPIFNLFLKLKFSIKNFKIYPSNNQIRKII